MQRFFFDDEQITDGYFKVTGEKYDHICKVLRMSAGEKLVFCDGEYDSICRISEVTGSYAALKVESRELNATEPGISITVFQCLPKGDKMDDVIKRCVQFGAAEIVPVISRRCVARPDEKAMKKKLDRWNKIALSSAMQSMRGRVPRVKDPVDYSSAIDMLKAYDSAFVCYELETSPLNCADVVSGKRTAFLIGPEGGLDESEAETARSRGVPCVSLGKRILRTEDAASFVIPIILFETDNL